MDVNNLDLKQEFLLVDEANNTATTFGANAEQQQQQINFTLTPVNDDKEGEQIMTSLHGFGQMSVGGGGAGSPFDGQQQQQQQMQQQQQQIPDYSGAYVKVVEQPLENKLRFR